MTAIVVKSYRDVLYSRSVELVYRLYNAITVIAHGVFFTRYEVNGQIFGNCRNSIFGASLFNYRKQNEVTVIRERKSAKSVIFVGVHVVGVFGKPVVFSTVGLEFFVV